MEATANIANFLKFLGRLWVIVTAVIGSLLVFGIIAIVLAVHSVADNHGAPTDLPAQHVSQRTLKKDGPDKIAVVNLSGEISEEAPAGGFGGPATGISAAEVIKTLDEIEKDNAVKAVVLKMNTPGGAVVASDEIYRKVREVRTHKPVVVSMSDLAASGGYYIASGADKIVANPATITGSIGVIAEFPEYDGLLSKFGVEIRTIKSGEFKDIGSPTRAFTPAEQAILHGMISEAYDQFVHSVADGRKMDENAVRTLADGRIYTGNQAKQNGLIDQLGTFDDAVSTASTLAHISHPTLVEFSQQNFLETLFGSKLSFSPAADAVTQILPHEKFGVYYMLQP